LLAESDGRPVVMRGLDPRIHVLTIFRKKGVDGRVKPGHDEF
jgi:hypothetical protein